MKNLISSLALIAALAIALPGLTACSKKTTRGAVATCVIGTVTLQRQGSKVRPVLFNDQLRRGDVVVTGRESFFAFQIGDEAVIKIKANTTLRIDAIWDNRENRFAVESGTMISTVKRLRRESSYQVITKTSLAAVRGTEFSVSYNNDKSTVAVNDGKIALRVITPIGPTDAPERVVEPDTAADIDAGPGDIRTRDLTRQERDDFRRSARIELVSDIEGKNETELKQLEQQIRERYLAPDEERQDESNTDTRKKGAEKKGPITGPNNNPAAKAIAATAKPLYTKGDTITVLYRDLPESRNAWIAIAKAGSDGRQYVSFQWTSGSSRGTMTFPSTNFEPGRYEVQVHFSRGNTVDKRYSFTIR